MMSLQLQLHGVITATVLPFKFDGSIDWDSYYKLLEYCATPEGISAIFVNGHAGEGATLDAEEREDDSNRNHGRDVRILLHRVRVHFSYLKNITLLLYFFLYSSTYL